MKDRRWIQCDKKRAAAAILAVAAMLVFMVLAVQGEGIKQPEFAAALGLTAAAGVFVLLNLPFGRAASAVLCLILPFASLWALENYNYVITDLTLPILLLNLAFLYLLYGLLIFLTGSVRRGCMLATLVPMLFGLANYFVVSFRGSPIVPWDLLSVGTAASVVDNYTFTLSWKAAFSAMAFVWMILLASKSEVRLRSIKVRVAAALAFLLLLGGYVSGIQKSGVQSFFGMDTILFTLNVMYRNNGIAGAFLGNLRYLNIEQPDGYSAAKVEEIAAGVEENDAAKPASDSGASGLENTEAVQSESTGGTEAKNRDEQSGSVDVTQYPNIIVIMNEAFSDLSVWGDFETSEEVMPFFRMMQEEGIGGEVYVSVKGGNTANTEFEFLTGDTMAFLPAGSVPYQQYINSETPALPGYLRSLGYDTLAIHPYNRSGWDRDEVYEYFGFQEFLDKNAFDNPLRMRGYISDRSAFDKIEEQFELKADDERMFIFEVTMQNHGGYSKETPDFTSYLKLTGVEDKTTSILATEKYLTLMNESDRALQDLILYFEEQDEPVIVMMFGDHQPSDYITNVIQRICGVRSDDTLEYLQQGYRVPFLIWSNQGLEHAWYDSVSVNYLGGILMDAAGIPKTGYQTWLSELMETLPVINGNVIRDNSGTFLSHEDDTYADLLNQYKMLQYNHLVDKKKRVESFFGG